MTGAVQWDVLIWVVGLMWGAGTVVAGFLFWVWRLVSGFNKVLAERDTVAQLEKERAKLVEAELRKELHEFKVHASETFATKEGVTAAVGRVEQAIERLTQRIDRVLEAQAHHPPPRPRAGG